MYKGLLKIVLPVLVCYSSAMSYGQATTLTGGNTSSQGLSPAITYASPATNIPIASFSLVQSGAGDNLTQVKFTTTGTYSSATDITAFTLYVNTVSNIFSSSTAVPSATVTATGPGLQTISLSTSYAMSSGSTYFFFIVPTVTGNPVAGHTIAVNSMGATNIVVSAGTVSGSANATGTITIVNPSILSTVSGSRCGPGSVTLNATPSAGATVDWYSAATGGSTLFTGVPFVTPSISSNTPYYARASQNVSFQTGTLSDNTTNLAVYNMNQRTDLHYFSSVNACTINSVDVYPAIAGDLYITMCDASGYGIINGVPIATVGPITISAAQVSNTVPVTIPLGFSVPAGATNYQLGGSLSGTAWIYRGAANSTYGPYPTTVNGFALTGDAGGNSTATGTSGAYSGYGARCYFYNWNITLNVGQTTGTVATATVNPVPTGVTASATPLSLCANSNLALNGTATGATTYAWTGPGGTPITSPSSISTGVTGVALGNAGVYTLTATQGPCSVSAATSAVTVNALPVPTFTVSPGPNTCVGTPVTYSTQSGQSNYVWTVPGTNLVDYTITAGGTGTGSNSVTISWISTGAKTVTVNYTNSNNCTGTIAATNTTTVNARPTVTFSSAANPNTCTGGSVTYATQPGQSSYVWSVPGSSITDYTITSGGTGGGSSSVTLTWLTAGSKTVTVNYNNAAGCNAVSPASNTTMVGLPTPTFTSPAGSSTCVGSSVTYTTQASENNYNWSVPGVSGTDYIITGGGTGLGNNSVTLTWNNAATRTVTVNYTDGNGCTGTTPATNTTTVNALPTLFIVTGGGPYCSGSASPWSVGLSSSIPGVTYQLRLNGSALGMPSLGGNGSGLNFGIQSAAGTYTVFATVNSTGCGRLMVSSAVITVNPLPVPTYTLTPGPSTCAGVNVTYATQSGMANYAWVIPGSPGTNYIITGGSTTSNSVTLKWLTAGAKTVTVNYQDPVTGCTGASPASNTTTVNLAVPTFTTSPAANSCIGNNVTYTTQSGMSGYVWSLPGVSGTDYTIASGGTGSGNNTVTLAWANAGNATVTVNYTDLNGCTGLSPASNTTNVNVSPIPTFTVSPGAHTCTGSSVTYTTQSGFANYVWNVPGSSVSDYTITAGGTGSGSNSVTLTWLTPGDKTVTVNYTNLNNCPGASPASNTTNVNLPVPTFTSAAGPNTCASSNVTYTTQGGKSAYTWSLPGTAGTDYTIVSGGTTASDTSVTVAWVTPGSTTVTVNYTDGNGCTSASPASNNTAVHALPVPTFTSSATANTCAGTLVTYTTQADQASYSWSVPGTAGTDYTITSGGTGSGDNTVTLSWATAGSTTVTANYTDGNGCMGASPASNTTMVNARPIPTFTTSPESNVCAGSSVTYTTQPTQSDYVWSVPGAEGTDYTIISGGTGTGDNTVTLSWITAGNMTVTANYSDANGCTGASPASNTALVNPLPAAIGGTMQVCKGLTTALNDASFGGSWASSDASTATVDATGVVYGVNAGPANITYTLTTGCLISTPIVVNPLPADITGNVQVCAGLSSALSDASGGGSWTSSNPSIATVDAAGGMMGGVSAGNVNVTYTLPTTCIATSPVTINPLPNVYTVLGGGNYCSGATGVHVQLSGSTNGISYQVYVTGSPDGLPVTSIGGPIDFGLKTTAGLYTVVATNSSTSCVKNMAGSVVVGILPLPAVYTVTGGGQYCSGGLGVPVGISGSVPGTNYQLYRDGSSVGLPMPGTGGVLSFGNQLVAGNYTIKATNSLTACVNTMAGSATVTINTLPGHHTITGGGSYCAGAGGLHIGLDGSTTGISYQLMHGVTLVGSALPGTGGTLDYGAITLDETYHVLAIDSATGCTAVMTGTATIVTNALPLVQATSGGGSYCAGTSGAHIGLDGSETGIVYQLYNTSGPIGGTVSGSIGPIDFGPEVVGAYHAGARNVITGCTNNMSGTVSVSVNPVVTPTVSMSSSVGTTLCAGQYSTLTATVTNEGTTSTYAWTVNGLPVVGGNTYTYLPSDGDHVAVSLTSSAPCATPPVVSASLNLSVLTVQTPAVAITTPGGNILCQGTPSNFTMTNSFPGAAPSFVWMVNGLASGTGTAFSYTPVNHDVVRCLMISNYYCATHDSVYSNNETMEVDNPLTPVVAITANPALTIADGESLTLTATATNAGPAPTYQWYINKFPVIGAIASTFTSNNFSNGDSVTCRVLSSGGCAGIPGNKFVRVVVTVSGVKQITSAGSDVRLAPNPNKGAFSLKGTLATADDQEVSLVITNMVGQAVYRSTVMAHNGKLDEQISLSNALPNGMYLLNMRAGDQNDVFHFVIEQ